ncbi:MAG: 30S ribosomal protein S1 [Anaerolineae bacterium]|nr:30S ribosomal protein S1 [Anaerolineae bacterium]
MVSKDRAADYQGELPALDEGWWSSVLSDEEMGREPCAKQKKKKKDNGGQQQKIDWEYVSLIFDTDTVITLSVYGYNRGGLLVSGKNLHGFVPISHLLEAPVFTNEEERKTVLSSYIGSRLQLKIIECIKRHERIVLSERAAAAGDGCRKQVFTDLIEGSIANGTVTNITDFGVFVDLGGVEGLIHVSELSWGRVNHPGEVVILGENIKTVVLQICEDTARVALSLKRLCPNPWETLLNRYQPGDVVPAQITAIMRFGAFARLENGVEGLIHNSSFMADNDEEALQKILKKGQQVEIRILHIDIEKRRMGLGLVLAE